MKKITTLLLLVTLSITAQKKVNCDKFLKILNSNRILTQKNNAVGIIDLDGNIIVPFQYENLNDIYKYEVSSTLFATKDINTKLKVLIDLNTGKNILKNIKSIKRIFVMGDYAVYETGENYRDNKGFYINSNGTILFELPQNDYNISYAASAPQDGIIKLMKYNYSVHPAGKQEYSYCDLKGKPLFNKSFHYLSGNFKNGLALNTISKEGIYYYGFIDINGNQKIDYKFSKQPTDFSNGMARVKSANGKFGFININGDLVIPPKYRSATGFYEGYALAQKENRKWILIDKEDKIIQEYQNIMGIGFSTKDSQRISNISTLIDEGLLNVKVSTRYNKIMNIKGEILFGDKNFEAINYKNGMIIYNSYNSEKRKSERIILNKLGETILVAEKSIF